MKVYLGNLVERMRQYSASLDKKETFVDHPWVYIDSDYRRHLYIFQRDGELLMAHNGQVIRGAWKLVAQGRSILINRQTDSILLNQAFIDTAVMVLRLDGTDENFILVNETLVPSLDVLAYLKEKYYSIRKIIAAKIEGGRTLELHNYQGRYANVGVTIDGDRVGDCVIPIAAGKKLLVVRNSRISSVFVLEKVTTSNGVLYIFRHDDERINVGNRAYLDPNREVIAPDGKYRVDFWKTYTVHNGMIK